MKLLTTKKLVLAMLLLFMVSGLAWSQGLPQISARFANPQFEEETKTYCLDVELQSSVPGQNLFGMNVRFFYDVTQLEFLNFTDFQGGYGPVSPHPARVHHGNSSSGSEMFNLEKGAGFVNGAVQLMDEGEPIAISVGQWTKYFEMCFEVAESVPLDEAFCPSLLWDLKSDASKGGFFRGDGGLVITLLENNPSSKQESAYSVSNALHFNWQGYSNQQELPYGVPVIDNCTALSQLTNTSGPTARKFELMQNEPNPFNDHTDIRFILPESTYAQLQFFDVAGKVVKVVKGDFNAGENVLRMKKDDFDQATNVLFYRLETSSETSPTRKMIFIK